MLFFFFMNRRPPRSPPFPYTTLFRSRGRDRFDDFGGKGGRDEPYVPRDSYVPAGRDRGPSSFGAPRGFGAPPGPERSEEHTSELQSHVNLVCRLLLEKKKKKKETSAR